MRRVPELDALRGLAASAIVLFHLRMGCFPGFGSAIDLFFVLSGYLITTIVLREWGTRGFLRIFYVRRALRIWPIYYLAIAACYLMNPLLPHPDKMNGAAYFWTYTQFTPGYWSNSIPEFSRLARHTWTLAVEEQFYLFWPVMAGLAGRKWLLAISLPMLLTPVVMRSAGFFPHMLLTRCDGLALGAILAGLLFDQERVVRHRRAFQRGFAGVLVVSLVAWMVTTIAPQQAARWWYGPPWHLILPSLDTARVAWIYFAIVGLVACSPGSRRFGVLRNPHLVGLGQVSYGLYLYHPFVFSGVSLGALAVGIPGGVWLDVVKVVVCVGVAGLSWKFVEKPILGLKDWFPYEARERAVPPYRPILRPQASRPHREPDETSALRAE